MPELSKVVSSFKSKNDKFTQQLIKGRAQETEGRPTGRLLIPASL
jgi:hypothetical protein